LCSHVGDPAIKVSLFILLLKPISNIALQNFLLKLKHHLLQRIHKSIDLSSAGELFDTGTIIIKDDHCITITLPGLITLCMMFVGLKTLSTHALPTAT
jgi:hypothetical protein